MLLQQPKSCICLIDVQEKLATHVHNSEMVIERCHWLLRLANDLSIPILVSEQYSKGLGATVSPLNALVSKEFCHEKVHFSCYQEPTYRETCNKLNKQQLVLIGIETHVCVLQSALEMKAAGYDVFVVVDAVSSRKPIDHEYGLQRMQANGIHLVTAEMVLFEWVKRAGTEQFKQISQSYLR